MVNSNKKKLGQYMTPGIVVGMILDNIGYTDDHVLNRKIMEPSFGDGEFLINIVQRIIYTGFNNDLSKEEVSKIIKENVYGIEYDKELYVKAINRLNSFLNVYGIDNFDWSDNLLCGDSLLLYNNFIGKMDYVVGNPPYVRIHNIPDEYRNVVKNFKFVDGMIDLYIVFYEIGIYMLNEKGKLGYISPNSFMKNTSQKKFRNYLVDNKYISAIFDFKTSKIFDDADTYNCICILNKNIKRVDFSIKYREYSMYNVIVDNMLDYNYFKNELKDNAWNLSSDEDIRFLDENKQLPIKIKHMSKVQNGISTNKDAVYVISVYEDKELTIPYYGKHFDKNKTVYFLDKNDIVREIESSILHRCVKASKYDGKLENNYIIFPYIRSSLKSFYNKDNVEIESGYEPLSEEVLNKKYPKAYKYLSDYWDELISRDMEKNSAWFLFGRSQGLQNSCYKKVVFKHIIDKSNPKIIPYVVDSDVIVYSGIYTTIDINIVISPMLKENGDKIANKYIFNEQEYDFMLKDIFNIYSSNEFSKYCTLVGKDMSGGYVGISATTVKEFGTKLNTFPSFPIIIDKDSLGLVDNNYMNKLFHDEFVKCIKESYINMGKFGKSSNKRVEPFHSFIAKVLQYKLGTDYDIYAAGYSYGKECTLGGNFDNKNVDICIKKNDKVIGCIAFKLLSNNFKQNNKNFVEGMLGEAVQMRDLGLPYAFCYLIPEKALYLDKYNRFDHVDTFSQNDLKVYYDICNDEAYKGRTPDALFVGVHRLFNDNYLNSLTKKKTIDIASDEYLNNVNPKWSSYEFIDDEIIKEYFIKNNNIGLFIDKFIESINDK